MDRHIAANIFDAINQQTRATGNWKKGQVPKFPLMKRPESKDEKQKRPKTVADLYQRFRNRR